MSATEGRNRDSSKTSPLHRGGPERPCGLESDRLFTISVYKVFRKDYIVYSSQRSPLVASDASGCGEGHANPLGKLRELGVTGLCILFIPNLVFFHPSVRSLAAVKCLRLAYITVSLALAMLIPSAPRSLHSAIPGCRQLVYSINPC